MKFQRSLPWILVSFLFGLFLVIGCLAHTEPYWVFTFVPPNPGPPYYTPINFLGLGPSIFGWLANYLLTSLLGFAMLKKMVPQIKTRVPLWISSFWLGYLGVCALTRLAQLVAPHWISYALVTGGILATCFPLIKSYIKDMAQTWWAFLIVIPLLIVLLVMQAWLVDFQWNGHGPHQYSNEWATFLDQRLPIIKQHYDEWIYHSFLVQPFGLLTSSILPWWMTLAFTKVSIAAFILLCFNMIGVSMLLSWLGTAFIFLGTASILPDRYLLLFDSANPLFYSVHSGRAVGISIIMLFLVWLQLQPSSKARPSLLFAAGMIATTFSNWMWLIPAKIFDQISKLSEKENARLYLCALIAFLAAPLFYISPPEQAYLNFAFVIALYFFVIQTIGPRRAWRNLKLKMFWQQNKLFILAYVGSALFLGNLFAKPLGKLLAKLLQIQFLEIRGTSLGLNFSNLIKDNRELVERSFNSYCYSFPNFVTAYGAFMCLVALAWAVARDKDNDWWRKWLVLFMLIWPFCFFFGDFLGHSQRAWIMTRFMEVPYYVMLFVSIYLIDRYARPNLRKAVAVLMVVYMVGPTLGSERPKQWLANFNLIRELVLDASSDY